MDENKLTRWHYIAAIGSLVFGAGSVAVEWGNYGIQRPVMWLLVGLLVALGYLLVTQWLPKWTKWFFLVLEVVILLGFLYALVYPYEWSGLGPQLFIPFVEPAKGLWDWFQLAGVLAVPVAVVVIGYFLQLREQERTAEQAKSEQARTDKQAETEQKIAEDRLQDQRLQNYLDRMSELLIEKGLGREGVLDGVKTVARARTLTTLRGLDGERKALLLKFLYESDLISVGEAEVDLTSADLTNANLEGARLERANLKGTRLEDANLKRARLEGANLEGANLERANLMETHLVEANLTEAYLVEAYLERAYLMDAKLAGARLAGARLPGARLERANLVVAKLAGAYLIGANLMGANLGGANLDRARLERANLERANLVGANLMEAYLVEANLERANLMVAKLGQANLERANLVGANLMEANLERANLIGANLMGANLVGANLMGAFVSLEQLKTAFLNETTIMPGGSYYQPPAPVVNDSTEAETTPDKPDETP